jgi:hypothetical protein
VIASAFAANGVALSSRLVIRRPIPGDGWQISDEARGRRYWIAAEGDAVSVYEPTSPAQHSSGRW